MRSIHVDLGPQTRADDRPLSDAIVGTYITHAKVGSVWFASMAADGSESRLRRCSFSETVVIIISQDRKWTHVLELSFKLRVSAAKAKTLNALAATLVQAWATRNPGLFTEALLANRPERPNLALSAPILSDSNPFGLSRSEFRLCLILSQGLSLEQVQDELKIKSCTLRSHLRQIRAKTDVTNTNELIHQLLKSNFRPGQAASEMALSAAQ